MKNSTLTWIQGHVRLVVKGERIAELVNLLTVQGIHVWDVVSLGEQMTSMRVLLPDFFRLRPLLKRTGSRMHVYERRGLPFQLSRLGRRAFFAAGVGIFILVLVLMSSLVWDVEVRGNDRLTVDRVLQAAKSEGLYPYQWKFRLMSQDKLSQALMRRLPDTSWVGVEIRGTEVIIQIVEAEKPEPTKLLSPRHLISKADAVITEIYAEQGRPVVSRNTRVKKGDILISGMIGDEQHAQMVVAKGEVKGMVWHEYEIEIPLVQHRKSYTGNSYDKLYLVLGNRAIQMWGYGQKPYAAYETVTEHNPLTWRDLRLPVGWMTERVMESQKATHVVSETEAKISGIEHAKKQILAKYGKGTEILGQKILHEKRENGKVYMKVLFEVEQYITEELPIVYNQGD
ncbi:sporulation protein YqfD [Paenibacillus massiliensis]|uniref:sporulation protein YqfD n=1 Tax=Paenibacillus massiliensis TaxID=225917 RepID=UPI0004272960|nr:sporulation protein YqfD [Paenibacillus massiliensis]